MASEIQFTVPATGVTYYVVITRPSSAAWYNHITTQFETFNVLNWSDYASLIASQFGTSKAYWANMPAIPPGVYNVTAFARAGGAAAPTDEPVAEGEIQWDGVAVQSLPDAAARTVGPSLIRAMNSTCLFMLQTDGTEALVPAVSVRNVIDEVVPDTTVGVQSTSIPGLYAVRFNPTVADGYHNPGGDSYFVVATWTDGAGVDHTRLLGTFRLWAAEGSEAYPSVYVNFMGFSTLTASAIATDAISAVKIANNAITAAKLDATAGQEIADAVLARNIAGGSDGGRTVRQALAATRNKVAFDVPAPGQFTVYSEDDSTPLWTGTYARGANTLGPLTATDPA